MVVFEIIKEVVCYSTARFLIPVLSFGMIRVERPSDTVTGFNWLGFRRLAGKKYLLDATMAGWVGLFLWIAVLGVIIALVR
jgi:hypothetical protein